MNSISGLPSSKKDSQLEVTVLKILEKRDVKVYPKNVEDCHWLKSNSSYKKTIIKLSKRKNGDKIRGFQIYIYIYIYI